MFAEIATATYLNNTPLAFFKALSDDQSWLSTILVADLPTLIQEMLRRVALERIAIDRVVTVLDNMDFNVKQPYDEDEELSITDEEGFVALRLPLRNHSVPSIPKSLATTRMRNSDDFHAVELRGMKVEFMMYRPKRQLYIIIRKKDPTIMLINSISIHQIPPSVTEVETISDLYDMLVRTPTSRMLLTPDGYLDVKLLPSDAVNSRKTPTQSTADSPNPNAEYVDLINNPPASSPPPPPLNHTHTHIPPPPPIPNGSSTTPGNCTHGYSQSQTGSDFYPPGGQDFHSPYTDYYYV